VDLRPEDVLLGHHAALRPENVLLVRHADHQWGVRTPLVW
jgi:hypothetical protein